MKTIKIGNTVEIEEWIILDDKLWKIFIEAMKIYKQMEIDKFKQRYLDGVNRLFTKEIISLNTLLNVRQNYNSRLPIKNLFKLILSKAVVKLGVVTKQQNFISKLSYYNNKGEMKKHENFRRTKKAS